MIDRKNLCPNCGAKLTGLELTCPECGYTLTSETSGGQNITDSLMDLQEKLLAIDKLFVPGVSSSKKKASIINAFPIPNTAEALVRLLHMSYSNYEAAKEVGDKKLSVAWLGKAVECYRRLSGMRESLDIAETLNNYKALSDKNAISKLSGSYSKKRVLTIVALTLAALMVAFVLLFDWTDYLLKKGRVEEVSRHFIKKGKTEELLERLVKLDLFEEASDIMATNGQVIQAVSMLAQKGYTLPALRLTAKTNNPDSIHLCVTEIGKYCTLFGREECYLDSNFIIRRGAEPTVSIVYDHNRFKLKATSDLNTKKIIWRDEWGINDRFFIPKQHYFIDSPFQDFYRKHFGSNNNYMPEIRIDNRGHVVSITFDERADFRTDDIEQRPFMTSYPLQYFFYYSGQVLKRETVDLRVLLFMKSNMNMMIFHMKTSIALVTRCFKIT